MKVHSEGLLAVFCICFKQWQWHDWGDPKVDFILRQLGDLSLSLSELNVALRIIVVESYDKSIDAVLELAKQFQIEDLYFNKEIEINEINRDEALGLKAIACKVRVHRYQDSCILAPGTIRTQQDGRYSVFTPYKKKWWDTLREQPIAILPKVKKLKQRLGEASIIPKRVEGFQSVTSIWKAGEEEAYKKLKIFMSKGILHYATHRDEPSLQGTSSLSPYLANGVISPRVCFQAALKVKQENHFHESAGVDAWCSELIWREFYRHLMVDVPRLCKHRAFKLATERLPWRRHEADFEKWCVGQTGIPLVDAAMRQLNQIHWMHNRLRMVVAMFLTKNLRIDWRWGERYFSRHLVDVDLAANNGGWQWSGSTGCDAAPYFRIFNPFTQSLRFDPDAHFIKTYLPELRNLSALQCHEPYKKGQNLLGLDYPEPMVDVKTSRLEAIAMFKNNFKN